MNEQKPSEAPAPKAKLSLNRPLFPKLQLHFHTAQAIKIEGRPHSDYTLLSELGVSKGLDIGECHRICFACHEFLFAIADVQ